MGSSKNSYCLSTGLMIYHEVITVDSCSPPYFTQLYCRHLGRGAWWTVVWVVVAICVFIKPESCEAHRHCASTSRITRRMCGVLVAALH